MTRFARGGPGTGKLGGGQVRRADLLGPFVHAMLGIVMSTTPGAPLYTGRKLGVMFTTADDQVSPPVPLQLDVSPPSVPLPPFLVVPSRIESCQGAATAAVDTTAFGKIGHCCERAPGRCRIECGGVAGVSGVEHSDAGVADASELDIPEHPSPPRSSVERPHCSATGATTSRFVSKTVSKIVSNGVG